MKSEQILIAPILTEKTSLIRSQNNVYVFRVDPRANKALVLGAVRELFKVTPIDCRLINVDGKKKRITTRSARGRVGLTSSWKKAYVSIRKGEILNLFGE